MEPQGRHLRFRPFSTGSGLPNLGEPRTYADCHRDAYHNIYTDTKTYSDGQFEWSRVEQQQSWYTRTGDRLVDRNLRGQVDGLVGASGSSSTRRRATMCALRAPRDCRTGSAESGWDNSRISSFSTLTS